MILYCDTSAFIKLYISEAYSNDVKQLIERVDSVAVSRMNWAEVFAALSRRSRESPKDSQAIEFAKQAIADDWANYVVIDVTQSVVELAGEFADTFALRGYDSVQLATAHYVQQTTELPVIFACFDKRLNKAANLLGMEVVFLNL